MVARVTVDIAPHELRRFELALGELVRRAGGRVSLVVRKVAFDLMRDIMRSTPVDTGRARAAWSTVFDKLGGAGVPITGKAVDAAEVAKGKSEGEASANLPARVPAELKALTPADLPYVEVTNNVRHILPLEFGYSDQAPNGRVRVQVHRHARFYLTGVNSELGKELR